MRFIHYKLSPLERIYLEYLADFCNASGEYLSAPDHEVVAEALTVPVDDIKRTAYALWKRGVLVMRGTKDPFGAETLDLNMDVIDMNI